MAHQLRQCHVIGVIQLEIGLSTDVMLCTLRRNVMRLGRIDWCIIM